MGTELRSTVELVLSLSHKPQVLHCSFIIHGLFQTRINQILKSILKLCALAKHLKCPPPPIIYQHSIQFLSPEFFSDRSLLSGFKNAYGKLTVVQSNVFMYKSAIGYYFLLYVEQSLSLCHSHYIFFSLWSTHGNGKFYGILGVISDILT